MATVRQVTSKIKREPRAVEPQDQAPEESVSADSSEEKALHKAPTKRVCQFCENKSEPVYWDITVLRRFMNDRGRITVRARTGACAKHQRRVAREIKHARHLAMLPFMVRV